MEGLRSRQPTAYDDPSGARISPAIPAACAASRVRAHSTVWISRQPLSHSSTPLGPQTVGVHPGSRNRDHAGCLGDVDLPPVRRLDGDRANSYRCGIGLAMQLLRHFMMPMSYLCG